jgi:thiosulfate reductase cytochrome b subunit
VNKATLVIPAETDAPSGPGQLSIVTVFLIGLGTVLLFWWLASGDVPVKTLADWLNTIGRVTALIGTYLLLWQLVLLARLPWLESAFGMDRLVWLHRWNAYVALSLITVHVVAQTIGYELDDGFSTMRQLGDFIEHYEGLLPAIAGFVLLILVTGLSIEIARRRLAYETWYFVHLYSYLAVALAFSHQLATGADFINNPSFTAYWWAIYALVFGALAVVTGIAIWKPVQLSWLTAIFGGYVWARYWHFIAMLAIVILSIGHIFMVFAVDPYSLTSMITGNHDPSLSPEARNARPFYHLFARRVAATPSSPPETT